MLIIPRVYRINIFPIKKKISTKFYLYLLRKIVRFFPIDITISISEGRNKQNLSRFIFKGYHTRIIEKPGISRRKRNTLNIFWRHLSTFSLRLFHRRIFTTQDRFSREIIEASIWNVATGRYSAPKNGPLVYLPSWPLVAGYFASECKVLRRCYATRWQQSRIRGALTFAELVH